MIEIAEYHLKERPETPDSIQVLHDEQDTYPDAISGPLSLLKQILRFGLVGMLNTLVDLLILNGLLLLFPTTSSFMLLVYNSLAYGLGAINSFLLNKYWTFRHRQRTTRRELVRFVLTTLCGIGLSNGIIWLASTILHPVLINATVWANASKVSAIFGTALLSYSGMRMWVFVSKAQGENKLLDTDVPARRNVTGRKHILATGQSGDAMTMYEQPRGGKQENRPGSGHSLSVILPAYNEEEVIAHTVNDVLDVLKEWQMDFEILIVNDGSTDRTGAIVAKLAEAHAEIHLVNHEVNQGYGAALVSGFTAAAKELTFFMDADGQFDVRDLRQFFSFIDEYDAVIGYRLKRRDSEMRKLNAWGWKQLIGWVLHVDVHDVDCAFKLLHTEFLRQHPLETRGAMINAELLYRLKRAGGSYREIGVHHLPRIGGRATGAKLSVIIRALRELFVFARKWKQEERSFQVIQSRLPTQSQI